MKRNVVFAASVIAVLLSAFSCKSGGEAKHMQETATAKKIDMSREVTATGTLEPINNVEVGTQVSGIISKIYVDYNSEVKKGQVLAELDKTTLEAELESQTSNMLAAKVEYEYQTKLFNRSKELHQKQMISDTEYELAEYNYLKSKNSYDKSRSDMVKSKTNLGFATIFSPIDGIVLSRAVDEGQTVAASFSTPTLFTIANDLTKMQVIADVDEADIGEVKEGQKVTFDVDAYPDDKFEGYVTQVRLEATTTSNVVTYEVVIAAPNPDLKLKPGLTANVTIKTLERNNVLSVPSKALKFRNESADGKPGVWVKNGEQQLRMPVSVGYDDRVNVEITGGLKEGDVVVVDETSQMAGAGNPQLNKEKSPFMQGPPSRKK